MNVDLRKWIDKKVMISLFIIIIGIILIYLGIFYINYTRDTITYYSQSDTGEIEYYDVDWVTEQPYVELGWWLFLIGLALLSIGIFRIGMWWKKVKK